MSKLILTKDPSHKGYYLDEKGNLYVFRFGGRPIKVDGYRDDKPRENIEAKEVEVEKSKVIDHRKSASIDENNKFIKELETELTKKSNKLSNTAKGAEFNKIEKELDELHQEKKNTIKRLEDTKKEFNEKWLYIIDKDRAQEELSRIREYDQEYNEDYKMTHRPDNDWHMTPDDLLGEDSVAPKDVYEHPEYYTIHSNKNVVKETKEALEKVKGNPDAKITIYRATTGDTINDGDWVTLSKSYAEDHNYSQLDGKGKVISKEVPVKDVEWAGDDLSEWGYFPKGEEYNNKMSAREFIKKQTGQREMYQSIAKLMDDNKDKLSNEEWEALDNARMILKQKPELIADDSILSDTSKPIHERLSEYMDDNEYKLELDTWGPLYKANNILRQNDNKEKTKLLDRYKQSVGVSDDWFTEEARKLKMSDEEIADTIYEKKGAEAQGSTDDNIKRIIANKEKQHYERLIKEYKDAINNPKTGEWDREFMKSELPGLENKAEMFANYEAEFIKRANKDDETFIVRYDDGKFTDNFRVIGLKEALNMKEELQKYSDDIHVYDVNGKELSYDKDRKFYTSPRYEENKRANMINDMRGRLYGADRSTLVSMINRLGLHLNVDNWTTAQLYRILEKELYKDKK